MNKREFKSGRRASRSAWAQALPLASASEPAMNNLAIGIAIGVAIGAGIGVSMTAAQSKKRNDHKDE